MTQHAAQYDHIGSRYDEYARTATLKRAESYTFLQMVGDLTGKRVMDLACGFGFYTRLLKQHGAATVLGVDISPEMIRLANKQEQAEPLGITYQVGDAVQLSRLGRFDLVTAVYLLNYAAHKDQLLGMFRSAYDNLVEGGRFVAYTVNPEFTLSKPNSTKYGVTVLRETPEGDRYACDAEFVTDPPTPVSWFRWSQATYERAVKEGGFRDLAWYPSEVAPEDIARYGEAYWQDFHDNCLVIGLMCHKM
ncbi:MAG TPA: class I SAM-dependent methyltransferase [Candidatus Tectomicrobia bacterium]|nr:class I SAM-dependent methyltransferase [Candidatus Tectomicrobia bacterium]